MTQMNLSTKQKETHRHREHTCGCQGDWGGKGGECRISRCKLLYIDGSTNMVLLYSPRNYIQYPVIKHNSKRIFFKEYLYVYNQVIWLYSQRLAQYCKTIHQKKNNKEFTHFNTKSSKQ